MAVTVAAFSYSRVHPAPRPHTGQAVCAQIHGQRWQCLRQRRRPVHRHCTLRRYSHIIFGLDFVRVQSTLHNVTSLQFAPRSSPSRPMATMGREQSISTPPLFAPFDHCIGRKNKSDTTIVLYYAGSTAAFSQATVVNYARGTHWSR